MNDAINLLHSMALGICLWELARLIAKDMGAMPTMPKKADEDEKSKLGIAECTISEGPIELQESYLESLSFWQHTSEFVEQELKKTKEAIETVQVVKSA